MTLETLRPLLADALGEMSPEGLTRLRRAIRSCEIDQAACCAAKVILNGESPYRNYANVQLRQMIAARESLRAAGVSEALTFGGPLVETMLAHGMDVPGLWIVECAYEGWFPGLPRSESEGLLKQLVAEA